jgi:hypothetical protein
MQTFSEYFSGTLRFIAGATVVFLTPLAMAQSGFVSLGGFTHTTDSVGIGITDPATSNAKVHVLSTSSNVLALYPPNSGGMGMIVTSALQSEGVPWGVSLQLTSVSNINVSGMQLGSAGVPIIESLGGYPLRLNASAVLGPFVPGDVVVGDPGLPNGLRVKGQGASSFNGNVGIGMLTDPNFRLQVTADGTGLWPGDNGNGQLVLTGATDTSKRLGFMIDTTNNVGVIAAEHYAIGPYNLALQPGGGNVGIGTNVPMRPLSFANAVGEKLSLFSSSSAPKDYYGFGIASAELQYQVTAGAHHSFYVGTSEKVRIDYLGNVGIGISVPTQKLSVAGVIESTTTGGGFKFPDQTLQYTAYPFNSSTNVADLNQNVPGQLTSSVTNTNAAGSSTLAALAANGTAYVRLASTEATPVHDWRVGMTDNTGIFKIRDNTVTGAAGDRMTISGSSIHFNGNVDGTTILATYQDLAEWVPASDTMAAGTVVIVGEDGDNTVTASTHAYDTSVAGVVSPNPGLLLGVASASKAKIATTGRVRVRVDATRSPIRKGDLLVTSDRPGMAMKSEPLDLGGVKLHRPGTLIGKALEPLASGEGEILVLLSMQ